MIPFKPKRSMVMDAVTPKSRHDTAETHSHVVRPAQMEWKKTRFAGCEVKGLLLDKQLVWSRR